MPNPTPSPRRLLWLTLLAGACSADKAAPAAGDSGADEPKVFGESLNAGWNIIEPGGDTRCARDTPFVFAVRPGTSRKIVVEFIGGGACWDEFTCGFADAIFSSDAEWVRGFEGSESIPLGVYDTDTVDNPIADYHHVLVPYCTGDIHWGDSEVVYAEGTPSEVPILHKGAVNAQAVLDWMDENYDEPEQVFSTGCSAGAYGAAMWSAHLAEQYPSADLVQLGDSGVGVITDSWFQQSFPSWNAEASFPTWIDSLDPGQVDLLQTDAAYLYVELAKHYENARFAQFNSYSDATQVTYYGAMGGGSAEEWTQGMLEKTRYISGEVPNFSNYIAGGNRHCVINANAFYSLETDGVALRDWVAELLDGGQPADVTCTDCANE